MQRVREDEGDINVESQQCISPVHAGSVVSRCTGSSCGSSRYCEEHRLGALRSYKKYKRISAKIYRLSQGTTISDLMKLHGALEAECSLRLRHQQEHVFPECFDVGHQEAIRHAQELASKCEKRLELLFLEHTREVRESGDEEYEEENEETQEDSLVIRKEYWDRKKRIRKAEKKWEKMERVFREADEEERKWRGHLEGLIRAFFEGKLRDRGVCPDKKVLFSMIDISDKVADVHMAVVSAVSWLYCSIYHAESSAHWVYLDILPVPMSIHSFVMRETRKRIQDFYLFSLTNPQFIDSLLTFIRSSTSNILDSGMIRRAPHMLILQSTPTERRLLSVPQAHTSKVGCTMLYLQRIQRDIKNERRGTRTRQKIHPDSAYDFKEYLQPYFI